MSGDSAALLDAAEATVKLLKALGADDAEAYVGALRGLSISHVGRLTYARELRESGIGVRITMDRRVAAANVEGISESARAKVAAEAIRRAKAKPEAPNLLVFPQPAPLASSTRIHPDLDAMDEERQARDASEVSTLLAASKDVTFHETKLLTYDQSFAIANTRGLAVWDRDAMQLLATEARVTRGGVSRTARESIVTDRPAREATDVARMAGSTVERARLALDSKPLPRQVDEVVLAPGPAAQVLKLWLPSLAGESEGAHAHPRAKRVGTEVAAKTLTVRDTPRASGGPRHQRVDDEGTPTRDTTLVEHGVLRSRLFNATLAARAGLASTGNAYRGFQHRWSDLPSVTTANVTVEPGSKSMDELISGMDRGVVLTDSLLGAFVANTRTADFSLVAPTCFYVERGSIVHALPSTTVGGDAHNVVQQVLAVGREPGATLYGQIPPLHVRGIACAT